MSPQKNSVVYDEWNSFYLPWYTTFKTENFVRVEWGQRSPFNGNAPIIDGEHALAGCVATAAAQLMSAFNYPKVIDGVELDWGLLKKNRRYIDYHGKEKQDFAREAAFLFRKIGDALKNNWGVKGGTSSYSSLIPPMLKEMGYLYPSTQSPYNLPHILLSLFVCETPVIMSGFRKEGTGFVGHAWICDGCWIQERKICYVDEYGDTFMFKGEERILLHCNWGWDGDNNGYFLERVFDSDNAVIADEIGEELVVNGNYSLGVSNITCIRLR